MPWTCVRHSAFYISYKLALNVEHWTVFLDQEGITNLKLQISNLCWCAGKHHSNWQIYTDVIKYSWICQWLWNGFEVIDMFKSLSSVQHILFTIYYHVNIAIVHYCIQSVYSFGSPVHCCSIPIRSILNNTVYNYLSKIAKLLFFDGCYSLLYSCTLNCNM